MVRLTDEELNRLPKWARQHINLCYKDADYQDEKIRSLFRKGPMESSVLLLGFHGHNFQSTDDQPVSDHTRVRFKKGERDFIDVYWNIDKDKVSVHGSQSLSVHPESSNAFSVALREKY